MIIATETNAEADRVQALAQTGRTVANIKQWVRQVVALVERKGWHLEAVIWHLGDETPRMLRVLRRYMAERITGVRWLLVTDDETLALALEGEPLATGLDDEGRRTCRTVIKKLERKAIRAMTFAIPLDPALGGNGVRVGRGPHTPWALCITEVQAAEVATVDGEGDVIKDADDVIVEVDRAAKRSARRAERRADAVEAARP